MAIDIATAVAQAQIADDAWQAAYAPLCPSREWIGDFRYTANAQGAPGSELRAIFEWRRQCVAEMNSALARH